MKLFGLTCTQWKAYATDKFIAGQTIVIPDCELQGALRQILQRDILVDKRVVPSGM